MILVPIALFSRRLRDENRAMGTRTSGDRQFYLWHVGFSDRLFALNHDLTCHGWVTWQERKRKCKCFVAFSLRIKDLDSNLYV